MPWRFLTGWSPAVIEQQRRLLAARPVADPALAALITPEVRPAPGWTVDHTGALLGYEPPGPPLPDGRFARTRRAIIGYRFADPRITQGHFDADAPLLGRDILVDIRVPGLRVLGAVRVGAVIDDAPCGTLVPLTPDHGTTSAPDGPADAPAAGRTRFGVRMDSLSGHLLTGAEWLSITKDHRTGAVRCSIDVQWRLGRLPTWWMGLGFRLLGRQFQQRWRRQAIRRLRALGDAP